MLKQLHVRNFALISEAKIQFEPNYSVITGETGSGKSILLGALNLILGERADYSVIRNKEEKTIVEAVFVLKDNLIPWFVENELDFDHETVLRREIGANGKSRSFINDTPVPLNCLNDLGEKLVYIHSQHETLAIKRSDFQMNLIDSFGNLSEQSNKLNQQITIYFQKEKEIKNLELNAELNLKEKDYLQFQLIELEKLEVEKHDFEAYEIELNRSSKLEEISQTYSTSIAHLDSENGLLDRLNSLKLFLEKQNTISPEFEPLTNRIKSIKIDLEDICEEMQKNVSKLENDPERLIHLQFWMDQFNHIRHKFRLDTKEQIISLQNEISEKLNALDNTSEKIQHLQAELKKLNLEINGNRSNLFELRKTQSKSLSLHLQSVLTELKLPESQLLFNLELLENFDLNGGMSVKLLFSSNQGMDVKPIEKAASGGELSRLMLAIQSTMSSKNHLPTIILDEIDTGVSGEVALKIAQLLQKMGATMQVFAITHLPQVASKAQQHFEVKKNQLNNETSTTIKLLSKTERIEAIAKLMSGEQVTDSARQNALELMQ